MGEVIKGYLEKDVKLKISIIGVGNAGNQIVEKAIADKYPVFAINSSIKDLSDSIINEEIPAFIIGNEARGAGKNREKAKELFKLNGKDLFGVSDFSDMVNSSDVIFVVAATSGGTGSGVSPELIKLFTNIYPNKNIIFYGILPKLSDSIMAQANTIQCMSEITECNVPYLLADLMYYEDIPNNVAYDEIGKHIMESINIIRGDYLNPSNSGMIDENDMRTIIWESGYMATFMLNNMTMAQVDKFSIQSYMINKIKNSPAVQIQRDKIIKQLGVIVNCPDEMMEATRTGNYNELTEYAGIPLSIFENYSVADANYGQFITILSGMSLPYSRISLSKNKIAQHEELLKRTKKVDLTADVGSIEFLNNRSHKIITEKDKDEPKINNGILDKYFN